MIAGKAKPIHAAVNTVRSSIDSSGDISSAKLNPRRSCSAVHGRHATEATISQRANVFQGLVRAQKPMNSAAEDMRASRAGDNALNMAS